MPFNKEVCHLLRHHLVRNLCRSQSELRLVRNESAYETSTNHFISDPWRCLVASAGCAGAVSKSLPSAFASALAFGQYRRVVATGRLAAPLHQQRDCLEANRLV